MDEIKLRKMYEELTEKELEEEIRFRKTRSTYMAEGANCDIHVRVIGICKDILNKRKENVQ